MKNSQVYSELPWLTLLTKKKKGKHAEDEEAEDEVVAKEKEKKTKIKGQIVFGRRTTHVAWLLWWTPDVQTPQKHSCFASPATSKEARTEQ